MFEIGDRVKWHSHGAEARGRVVRVAYEDGEVNGFRYRASRNEPRSIVELEDGAQVAHREEALSPG